MRRLNQTFKTMQPALLVAKRLLKMFFLTGSLWIVHIHTLQAQCVRTVSVTSNAALSTALSNAQPGDCISLANGTYAGFTIQRNDITIQAANKGGATISSGIIKFAGVSNVLVRGLRVTTPGSAQTVDGEPFRVAVWFDDANDCRIAGCTFQLTGHSSTTEWVMLGGNSNRNRIDHNEFGANSINGHYIFVRGNRQGISTPTCREDWATGGAPFNPNMARNTRVDFNYFHDQASSASAVIVMGGLGSAGDYQDTFTLFENNLLINCDGDAEIVEVKSSSNTVRNNTIRTSIGMISLRAGNKNTVTGNLMLQAGKSGSGGIKIYERDHIVTNNYVDNQQDYAFVMGAGDSYCGGSFGHAQVVNALVDGNIFVNSNTRGVIIGHGGDGTVSPRDCRFTNNAIRGSASPLLDLRRPGNTVFSNNTTSGSNPPIPRAPLTTSEVGPGSYSYDEPVPVPAAPTNLTATAISSSQINLSWTDNSSNEANFRIERSTDAGATWSFLANAAANATTFSNTGLAASTAYHYRVRAENTGGNSTFSNTASATTTGTGTLPAIGTGTTQAESLNMVGYETNLFEGVTCARALSTTLGHIKGTFTGSTGSYNLTVRAFDENDGAATLTARVNGVVVGTRTLSTNDHTWKNWVINNVTITNGDEIRIEGAHQAGEHARIDYIQVAEVPVSGDLYLEAESGTITAPMGTQSSTSASGGQYITVAAGNNSQTAAPSTGRATYTFSVASAGTYKVWGRVIAPTTSDDSFWVRMDGGTWINWNEIALGTSWHWDEVHNAANANTVMTYSLAAGSHTLDIAYREDGTQLDRILITSNLSLNPNVSASSVAEADGSPEALVIGGADEISSTSILENYPNPASDETSIRYVVRKEGNVRLILHNTAMSQSITLINEHKSAGVYSTVVDLRPLPSGIHAIRLIQNGKVSVRKLIKR